MQTQQAKQQNVTAKYHILCNYISRKKPEKAMFFMKKRTGLRPVNAPFSTNKRYVYYKKVCLFLIFVKYIYQTKAFEPCVFSISLKNPYKHPMTLFMKFTTKTYILQYKSIHNKSKGMSGLATCRGYREPPLLPQRRTYFLSQRMERMNRMAAP